MTVFAVSMVEMGDDEVSASSEVFLDKDYAIGYADSFMCGAVGRFLDIDDFSKERDAVDKWVKERSGICMGHMKWERTWKSDDLGGMTIVTCVQETEI